MNVQCTDHLLITIFPQPYPNDDFCAVSLKTILYFRCAPCGAPRTDSRSHTIAEKTCRRSEPSVCDVFVGSVVKNDKKLNK